LNQSNSDPLVSVVIPLFNKEKDVLRAVNSVLSQTIYDFEIVVVNDGSTDKGPDLVRVIKDPRIKVIDQENLGVSAARNRGITETRGELIAFLDADDEWKPDFLETILRLKGKFPECEVFGTNYRFHYQSGGFRSTIINGLPTMPWEGILENYFEVAVSSDPPLWSSAVAVTRKAITSIGGFPQGVSRGEDLLTWARLAVGYKIAYSMNICSIFHKGIYKPNMMARPTDSIDYVGRELCKLLEEFGGESLKKYVALWYRMRASIYLQLGLSGNARSEIRKFIGINGINMRILIYGVISLLPGNIARKTLLLLQKVLRFSR
jgi:glycosyltransferase involved in cell wall biosynthesis